MWEFASWLRLDRPPTRVGVYQVDCLDGWYSFWDGARFNSLGSDPEDAYERRNELGGGYLVSFWRGLAQNPEAA